MDAHEISRKFQRTLLPDTIGLRPGDQRAYYQNLQRQPIELREEDAIGLEFTDFKNKTTIYFSFVKQEVTTQSAAGITTYKCYVLRPATLA